MTFKAGKTGAKNMNIFLYRKISKFWESTQEPVFIKDQSLYKIKAYTYLYILVRNSCETIKHLVSSRV